MSKWVEDACVSMIHKQHDVLLFFVHHLLNHLVRYGPRVGYPLLDHLEKNPQRYRSDRGKWCSIRYRWLNEGRKQRGEKRRTRCERWWWWWQSNRFFSLSPTPAAAASTLSLGRSDRGCFKWRTQLSGNMILVSMNFDYTIWSGFWSASIWGTYRTYPMQESWDMATLIAIFWENFEFFQMLLIFG